MPKKPKLASGKRFKALQSKLANQPRVYSPGGLAATIGRRKYGATKMGKMAARGRKRHY